MEEEQYQANNKRNPVFWILIIIVIIIIGWGAYYVLSKDDGTNTNGMDNVNATTNANFNDNINVAVSENTNTETNINETTNTNTTVNTGGWETVDNSILGIQFQIPNNWQSQIVLDNPELNQSLGDTTISSGECGTPCVIGQDICEIGFTANLEPGITSVEDPRAFIQTLSSYNSDAITTTELSDLSFYKTKVAITPQGDDGSQDTGPYALFGETGGTKYYAAALSKGYLNTECLSMFDNILSTIEIK